MNPKDKSAIDLDLLATSLVNSLVVHSFDNDLKAEERIALNEVFNHHLTTVLTKLHDAVTQSFYENARSVVQEICKDGDIRYSDLRRILHIPSQEILEEYMTGRVRWKFEHLKKLTLLEYLIEQARERSLVLNRNFYFFNVKNEYFFALLREDLMTKALIDEWIGRFLERQAFFEKQKSNPIKLTRDDYREIGTPVYEE